MFLDQSSPQQILELLTKTIEIIPAGILVVDRGGRIVFANPRAEEVLGLQGEALRGRSYNAPEWRITDEEGRLIPDAALPFQLIRETGKPLDEFHLSIEWPDGRRVFLSINGAPLCDADGEVTQVVFAIEEITEHRKLQETERLLGAIVQASGDAILCLDRNGTILSWNRAAEQIYGYAAAEAVGHPIALLLPPDRSGEYRELMTRLDRGGPAEHFESERVRRDGRRITVSLSASPLKDQAGDIIGLSITSRDITDRLRSEEELRKLSSAIEQSPVSILITDAQGRIEFVNPKFTQMTGYRADEAQGENPRILKSGHTSDEEYRRLWATISGGQVWQGELLNRKKDGDLFWEKATIAPVRSGRGEITHFIAIKEDITDRKKLEDQLRHSQKMEAVGLLAGGIAHDFNNILTAIIGYSTLLDMKMPAGDPLRLNVTQIIVSANRAAELTHSLLAFSRKQVIHLEPLDLNQAVRQTETFLQRLLPEDIELQLHLVPEPLTCQTDRGQLEQVLMNLASNSRDAMPQGGRIVIETGRIVIDSEFILSHGYGELGDYALISFSDTGIGMDETTRPQIFEPFFTTKEVGKGTGLGLAMVYGMVKQHGGYITVDSEPGRGTTFRIYLPLVLDPAAREVPDLGEEPAFAGGTETILVADDDAVLRNLAEEVLIQFGYTVLTAADGEEALDRFRENLERIDLAILDVVMPKRNGREVFDTIRLLRPQLPVLFISGYTDEVIHRHGVIGPTQEFIQKPMSPLVLLKKVREVLDR